LLILFQNSKYTEARYSWIILTQIRETMTEKFNPEQFTVPAGFPEILKDLNREILRAQPKDIYQFWQEIERPKERRS
jgi:hypothetical protein